MCKFNQNLFIATLFWCGIWLALSNQSSASPIDLMGIDDFIDEPTNEGDHDLTYDQRQNGTENIRLNLNGVVIAFPSASSSQASSAVGSLAANYLLQLAAGDDDSDDANYFPFVKNANNQNGVTAPTADAIELSKKKNVPKLEHSKDNTKRVVIVKEGAKDGVESTPPRPSPTIATEEQFKLDVVPVKKVQSRRKNK